VVNEEQSGHTTASIVGVGPDETLASRTKLFIMATPLACIKTHSSPLVFIGFALGFATVCFFL